MDMYFDGQFPVQLHEGTREGERLYMTSLSGNTCLDKVVATVTGAEMMGMDDLKRSNQCHYVCIKL